MDLEKEEKEREARWFCYRMFAKGLFEAVIWPDQVRRLLGLITMTEREGIAYSNGVRFAFWLVAYHTILTASFRNDGDLQECFECFAEGFVDAVNGKSGRRRMPWPDLARKRMTPEDFAAWQQVIDAYNNGLQLSERMAYGPPPAPIRIDPETGRVC